MRRVRAGDHLYLFTRAADLPLPDQIFTVRRVSPRLEAGRFFGELAPNADADLAEIAHLYGLRLDPADAAGTLKRVVIIAASRARR